MYRYVDVSSSWFLVPFEEHASVLHAVSILIVDIIFDIDVILAQNGESGKCGGYTIFINEQGTSK
jgi:hypothetical protein